ncbi:pilus assembly protein [Luteibacter sp. NPDC031894]|uniref:pilus assembly protein n=1 Tax=Luteibacter sp. NPDC031894 TaxID=3390572 RepID=UPI003D08E7B7
MNAFRLNRHGLLLGAVVAFMAAGFGSAPVAHATAVSNAQQQANAYAVDPPLGVAGAAPLVMLNLSRDHQLFYKAYNDFSDLNNDGALDTTYNNAFTYAGYFDPSKCYAYSNSMFVPKGNATNHYCTSQWSGNFLNWVTMTRMDEVRKILYGGLRSTDTTDTTVLERAHLPMDAHSFAKFYNGTDIASLTPYNPSVTRPTQTLSKSSDYVYSSTTALSENNTSYTLLRFKGIDNTLKMQVGDQIRISTSTSSGTLVLDAPVRFFNDGHKNSDGTWTNNTDKNYVTNASTNRVELRVQAGMFSGTRVGTSACTSVATCMATLTGIAQWSMTNLTRTGISFCNTTPKGSKNNLSQGDDAAPLLRMQTGDMSLWGSNESLQCQWSEEKSNSQSGFDDGFLSNGNRAAFSGLGASAENPRKGAGTSGTDWAELNVRVQVCVSGLIGQENCKKYPNDQATNPIYKPVGLLQKYGESGNIKFGLVTPSFDKNASGGVVRAALPGPDNNSGDFIANEIDAATGVFNTGTSSKGIISNINALRIYGYQYGSGNNYGNGNGCTYQQVGITSDSTQAGKNGLVAEGNCSSWGNPMAESYIETLRYLSGGKSPTASFIPSSTGTTEDATLGLTAVTTWTSPITEANFCAALNVINFNASSLSYDTDAVSGFDDLNTKKSVGTWTNLVATGEGITGKSWFVGNAPGATTGADLCSAKVISDLSGVQGICPESPALKGGYLMAGAAYGAHINRIRDLGNDPKTGDPIVPVEDRTSLKVTTFGVQLATNTPQIRVAVPGGAGKFVTIIPAYRLTLPTGVGGGALVDFKVLNQQVTTINGVQTATGSFYADWEDSFAGGDYDQDMWGIITYAITKDTVKITTKPVAASTNNGQGFGYIVSGTTKDGPHFHSGIYGFNYTDPVSPTVVDANGNTLNNVSGSKINTSGGCTNCTVTDQATTGVYAVGNSAAGTLSDPLLYASKWGGFRLDTTKADGTDTPANDLSPLDTSKWDADKDGIPDNYFLVTDPGKLETSLDALFRKILAKIASGTAAATVATSANGTGVTYQALYEAERTDNSGRRATWSGSLSGLWTDEFGYLREDGNGNGQLDDYITDPVIVYSYQAGGQKTVATRYVSTDAKKFVPGNSVTIELADIKTLWNARNLLWNPGLKANVQRAYATAFSDAAGRYIFTWIDANRNGVVDNGEVQPFAWSTSGSTSLNANNYRFLNSDNAAEAQNIVTWVRGTEVAGMRNRTVDFSADNASLQGRVARLGDIVNSTPLVVSAPAEAYDLLYNDTSYADFRNSYRNRRQMVYVGANDGMIHAFNGGFYNTSCQRFTTQPTDAICTADDRTVTGTVTAARTAHPLGAEVWAYVPGNLLPHLRWLTDPNYKHVYYVDGSPVAFDVKTFTADDDHVEGWGTVLVVPFRLGGGTISVATSTDPKTPNTFTGESAYVVMDITNPEKAPRVLAELTFPGTRTTSQPAMAVIRDVPTGDPNQFYLAIGSGPTDAGRVGSSANLRVKIYNMKDLTAATPTVSPTTIDLGAGDDAGKKSFAGDLIASDFNLDGKAEAIYFGSVYDRGTNEFGGHFWKIAINGEPDVTKWGTAAGTGRMLNMGSTDAPDGMPVTIRPTLARNERGAPMAFFGTGRLFTTADKTTAGQQRIYGLIDTSLLTSDDPQAKTTVALGNLVDVTNLNIFSDKSVTGVPTDSTLIPKDTNTFDALSSVFDSPTVAGWYRNLQVNGTNPSERVVSAQALLGGLLLTTTYVPGTSICTGLGNAYLVASNYKTGTADPGAAVFGTGTGGRINDATGLGQGLPAPPSLHAGSAGESNNGSKKVTACTQTSTGAIVCKDVATLKPVTSGETSWREPQGNK